MPIARRSLAALVAGALITTPVGLAAANSAAPIDTTARLGGPRLAAPSPLVVDEEKLSLRCDEGKSGASCTFEARYRVSNPTAEPHGGIAAFYSTRAEDVVVRVDGRDARVPLSAADTAALDNSLIQSEGVPSIEGMLSGYTKEAIGRAGFKLELAPGASALIVATGVLESVKPDFDESYSLRPLETRHLALHAGAPEVPSYRFDYLISPIKTWAEVRRMEVSIRYPSAWALEKSLFMDDKAEQRGWSSRREGALTVLTAVTAGKEGPKAPGSVLQLIFTPPHVPIEHGGPFLGLGGVLGDSSVSNVAGFRLRVGYEVALPKWLIESIAVDADFRSRVFITPALEAALPQILIIPSLGVGVGVPVQVVPAPRAGVRLMGSVQFLPVGFVTAVDIFPSAPENERVQVSLMGRFSL